MNSLPANGPPENGPSGAANYPCSGTLLCTVWLCTVCCQRRVRFDELIAKLASIACRIELARVTKRRNWNSNQRPLDRQSYALTTELPCPTLCIAKVQLSVDLST